MIQLGEVGWGIPTPRVGLSSKSANMSLSPVVPEGFGSFLKRFPVCVASSSLF